MPAGHWRKRETLAQGGEAEVTVNGSNHYRVTTKDSTPEMESN